MTARTFRRQLLVNSVASGAANVWTMIAGLVSVPLMLSGLGAKTFGIWALVGAFSASNGWLSLADFGIGIATTRRVAEHASRGDLTGARRVVSAGLSLVLSCAVVGGGLLAGAAHWFLPALFHTSSRLAQSFTVALSVMAVQVVLDLVINMLEANLEGLQRVDLSRAVDSLRRFLVIGATATAAIVTGDLVTVAIASLVATFLSSIVVVGMVWRHLPVFLVRPSRVEGRALVRVGREVAALRPLGIVLRTMDRFLVGAFLGPAAVSLVEVVSQLVAGAEAVVGAASHSVVPAAAWLGARGDRDTIRALLLRGTRYSLLASVPVALGVATFGGPFISVWLDGRYPHAGALTAVAAVGVLVAIPLAVGSQLLVGLGRTRVVMRAAIVAIVFNLAASIILLNSVGVVGVFVATALANLVLVGALGPGIISEVELTPTAFLTSAVAPALPATFAQAIVGVGVLRLHLAPISTVVAGSVLSVLVFACVAWFTGITASERNGVLRRLHRPPRPSERALS